MQSVKLRHRSPAGDGNCGQQPRPHGRWCDPPSNVPSQQRCPGHGGVGKAHVSPTVSSLHCCSSKAMGPVPQPKNLLLTCVMLTSPAEQGPATALMATAAITSAWRAVFAIILVLMNSKSPPQFRMVTSVEPAPLARAFGVVVWVPGVGLFGWCSGRSRFTVGRCEWGCGRTKGGPRPRRHLPARTGSPTKTTLRYTGRGGTFTTRRLACCL